MPITIEVNEEILDRLEKKSVTSSSKIDFVPARFDGEGPANRADFFDNYLQIDGQYLKNALRGYPLIGEKIAVPTNFKGVILQETRPPLDKDSNRLLRVTEVFDEFTYWNYDKIPSDADAYKQAMQALIVSNELSRPVSESDVEEEIASMMSNKNSGTKS